MDNKIKAKISEKVCEAYNKQKDEYDDTLQPQKEDIDDWAADYLVCYIRGDEECLELEITKMYSFVGITFAFLCELSEMFQTKLIDLDHQSGGGCETCNYGSSYTETVTIREPKLDKFLADK